MWVGVHQMFLEHQIHQMKYLRHKSVLSQELPFAYAKKYKHSAVQ